uniref:Uncharacterized protein n=1 Tax=Xiphophorus couchianus TaxID=32473 RepID=A0A3B5M177_9TELE
MPGEATETVPVTEQEMQQPQAETGLYSLTSQFCTLLFCISAKWGAGS